MSLFANLFIINNLLIIIMLTIVKNNIKILWQKQLFPLANFKFV